MGVIHYPKPPGPVDEHTDVDNTTVSPTRDDVPKWNGTNWVPAAYDYTFEFSIATFSDGMSTADELIGDGIWKAIGAITFTASYDNGPPTNADVDISGAASGWGSPLDMMGDNDGSGPTLNAEAVVYPASNGGAVTFTLTANVNGDEDTAADGASKNFFNYFKHDDLDHNSGFDDADITSLASQIISNDITRSISQSIGASNYLVIAHRTGDGAIAQVRCGTGTNEITVAMNKNDETAVTPLKETVGHTNSAGNPKTEDFYVYSSKLQNLDSHSATFTTLSSSTPKNYIYYGGSTTASGYTEGDVEGLDEGESTTDHTQTWDEITLDASEYFIFAMPARFATPTFFDNETGFEAAFEAPETVSITNACGFKEDYKVFRSENILGPGTFTLRTA